MRLRKAVLVMDIFCFNGLYSDHYCIVPCGITDYFLHHLPQQGPVSIVVVTPKYNSWQCTLEWNIELEVDGAFIGSRCRSYRKNCYPSMASFTAQHRPCICGLYWGISTKVNISINLVSTGKLRYTIYLSVSRPVIGKFRNLWQSWTETQTDWVYK